MTLAGKRMYVVTDPNHVTAVYRNTRDFTIDFFIKTLMRGFGVSEDILDMSFRPTSKAEGNPKGLPMTEVSAT
jgi:hypothetical protein